MTFSHPYRHQHSQMAHFALEKNQDNSFNHTQHSPPGSHNALIIRSQKKPEKLVTKYSSCSCRVGDIFCCIALQNQAFNPKERDEKGCKDLYSHEWLLALFSTALSPKPESQVVPAVALASLPRLQRSGHSESREGQININTISQSKWLLLHESQAENWTDACCSWPARCHSL